MILLANEDRLWGEAQDEKEKVIGRTLPVVPDIDAALPSLLGRCAHAGDWLEAEAVSVRDVFRCGGHGNLRALGQALWDFDRLYAALGPRLHDKADAMRALLRVFLALSLEVKAGNLTREDLQRRGAFDFKGETPDLARLRAAKEKYGDEEILGKRDFSVLPPDLSAELICDGALDGTRVNAVLSATPRFRDPEAEPEWATILGAFHRAPQDVRDASAEMEQKFADRAYTIPGEILQVFHARMRAGELGLIAQALCEIEGQCRDYIDDLKNRERLPEAERLQQRAPDEFEYGGYVTRRVDSDGDRAPSLDAFWRLEAVLRKAREDVLSRSMTGKAQKILSLIEAGDADGVRTILVRTANRDDGEWLHLPVLKDADAEAFAQAIARHSGPVLGEIGAAFAVRYKAYKPELDGEERFLSQLVGAIEAEASRIAETDTVHAWQIRNLVNWRLRPALDNFMPEPAPLPDGDGKA